MVVVAACASGAGSSPGGLAGSFSPAPPIVTSAEDAAARVIASDRRFEGAIQRDPQMIGGSRWWEATANADGTYTVKVTLGWGDCPAGCINQHTWTYRVERDGSLKLLEESGIAVPASLAP